MSNDVQSERSSLTFMASNGTAMQGRDDANSPHFLSPACRRMNKRSRRCRDLLDGMDGVLSNVGEYLPTLPQEDPEDYRHRKSMISLRNYYALALTTIMGKMFAKPPRLKPDVPVDIQVDLEDADMEGAHWAMVARDFALAAVNEGMAWLFVDYQATPDELLGKLTLADEKRLGARPYWFVVEQHNILGVRHKKVGKVRVPTMIRFKATEEYEDGDFGTIEREVTYIYEENRIRKIKVAEDGSDVLEYDVANTLGRVPAVSLNLNRTGKFEAKPTLDNLARMCIEHMQIRSDQRRALSVASYPILVTSGVEVAPGETTRIGPMRSIMLEDHQASVKWVESQGIHIRLGMDELKKLEEDIRTFGFSFENPQMYATATGRSIDASDAIAPLQMWSMMLADALEVALSIHAAWRKQPEGGSVDVHTAFIRNIVTVEDIKILIEAYKEGAMTARALLQRLKDWGLLAEDFDVEKDLKDALAIAEDAHRRKMEEAAASKPPENTNPEKPDDQ